MEEFNFQGVMKWVDKAKHWKVDLLILHSKVPDKDCK